MKIIIIATFVLILFHVAELRAASTIVSTNPTIRMVRVRSNIVCFVTNGTQGISCVKMR